MEDTEGAQRLVERVAARFPPGGPSQDLIQALQQQGFAVSQKTSWKLEPVSRSYRAEKVLPILVTNCLAVIEWKEDRSGRVRTYDDIFVGCAWL